MQIPVHTVHAESGTPPPPPTGASAGGELQAAATRELARAFARALATGDRAALELLLGEQAAYQAPGRSAVSGTHVGRHAVVDALTVTAAPGTEVAGVDVTELMADGHRAFVALLLRGSTPSGPFQFELGLHLQTDGERVVGVTEYSGDQYTADLLVGGPQSAAEAAASRSDVSRPPRRRRRLLRRSR